MADWSSEKTLDFIEEYRKYRTLALVRQKLKKSGRKKKCYSGAMGKILTGFEIDPKQKPESYFS